MKLYYKSLGPSLNVGDAWRSWVVRCIFPRDDIRAWTISTDYNVGIIINTHYTLEPRDRMMSCARVCARPKRQYHASACSTCWTSASQNPPRELDSKHIFKMADKEATVYIVDVGRSMGECRNGRSVTDLDWAMQYVWDRITTTVCDHSSSKGSKLTTVARFLQVARQPR